MKYIISFLFCLLHWVCLTAQKQYLYPICKDSLWGFMNDQGEIVINPTYSAVGFVSIDSLLVCKNGVWGIIDKNNKWVIKPYYEELYQFNAGLAKVKVNNLYGFISESDSFIIKPEFEFASNFSQGYSITQLKKKSVLNYYLLSEKGKRKKIVKAYDWGENGYWETDISEGKFLTVIRQMNGKFKFQYYDLKGCKLFTIPYFGSSFKEGKIKVWGYPKAGFLNVSGKIIGDLKYDNIYNYRDSLAAVLFGVKWGFIDHNGNQKIEYSYDSVYSFSNGLALVCLNGNWIFIDKNGNKVISINNLKPIGTPKIARLNHIFYESSFIGNLAMVLIDGKLSYIDRNGKIIWQ